ncbi:hypothetical protein A0H81_03476 [Grifola frondosa]|uniref:Uncharacterized protein n=1 Tax=Grifola frondosa TaxID=5627 RepID=A0A1C7MHP3_GRIFR|nr:hypothetical protein A0H81_03476 [Grifola frondosa]
MLTRAKFQTSNFQKDPRAAILWFAIKSNSLITIARAILPRLMDQLSMSECAYKFTSLYVAYYIPESMATLEVLCPMHIAR